MKVFFYSALADEIGDRLQKIIETVAPQGKVVISRTIGSLTRTLCQPVDGPAITVLRASSRDELLEIFSIRRLLRDVRIILILPDQEDETVAMGHRLGPRLLTYAGGDFADVFAVLGRMIGRGKQQ